MRGKIKNRLVLFVLIAGILNIYSCDILSNTEGVLVEVYLSVIENGSIHTGNNPDLEQVSLNINTIFVGNSVSEEFQLPSRNTTFLLTEDDNNKLLFQDYISRNQFRAFDVSIGSFLPDSGQGNENTPFLQGNFEGDPFTLELPDTLNLFFELTPPLNINDQKDAFININLQLDYSNWFINEDQNLLDPRVSANTPDIIRNIENSMGIQYEILTDGCKKPSGECDMIGNGRDQSGLIEITGDTVEENGEVLTFQVTLSEPLDNKVSVDYESTDNSAKNGEDYIAVSGTLLFEPGEILKTVPVTVLDDSLKGPNKSFTMRIMNVSGANLNKGKSRARGVIIDDDRNGNGNGGGNGNGNGGGNGHGGN